MHLLLGEKLVSKFKGEYSRPDFELDNMALYFGDTPLALKLESGREKLFIFGEIHYFLNEEDQVVPYQGVSDCPVDLFLSSRKSLKNIVESIEGHFVGVYFDGNGSALVFNDCFAREDVYYFKKEDGAFVSVELKNIIGHRDQNGYDQTGLANFMNVYGFYAPKKHTLYSGVKRLGVGEYINFKLGKFKVERGEAPRETIKSYSDLDLDRYFDLFKSSIQFRSTSKGINWIYMSSGWDSSSILAMLVDLHGPSRVRCVINRLTYSSKVGIVNNFEIERAKKITDYFSVPLDIVDMDFGTQDYLDHFNEIKDDLRSKSLLTFTAEPFWRSARFIKRNGTKDDVIFSGEISDGAHNFGHAQYATILNHSDLGFREYSDKMASYLFGPSFFKKIQSGEHKSDLIFNLLKDQKNIENLYDPANVSEAEWKKYYAASFFLSPGRFPFAPLVSNNLLSEKGSKNYLDEITNEYFSEFIEEANSSNLYSWWLHLYNSFHWQGNTVQVIVKSPASQGLKVGIPFWDKRLINFLSSMPEDWGRGLEIRNTKYPLKKILSNKIDYPSHLQTGPHSYIYDVDSSWSAEADFLYESIGVEGFKKVLSTKVYHKYFDPQFFNVKKLDELVDGYISGQIVTGVDRSLLVRLVCLCSVGLY